MGRWVSWEGIILCSPQLRASPITPSADRDFNKVSHPLLLPSITSILGSRRKVVFWETMFGPRVHKPAIEKKPLFGLVLERWQIKAHRSSYYALVQCPPYISCVLQTKDVTFESALKAIFGTLRLRKWRGGSQDKQSPICAASWHGAWQPPLRCPLCGVAVLANPLMECHRASVCIPGSVRTGFLQKGSLASGWNEQCNFSSFYIFILPKKIHFM